MGRTPKVVKYNIEEFVNSALHRGLSYKVISELVKLKYGVDVSFESIYRWAHHQYVPKEVKKYV